MKRRNRTQRIEADLREGKLSVAAIASRRGVTPAYVYAMRKRMGLAPLRAPKAEPASTFIVPDEPAAPVESFTPVAPLPPAPAPVVEVETPPPAPPSLFARIRAFFGGLR